ncbi:unnamed protein product, partial [Iphiclides podalirius]
MQQPRFTFPQHKPTFQATQQPKFGYQPPRFPSQQPTFTPPTQGYRFGIQPQRPSQAPNQRPPFQYGGFKFGIPHQQIQPPKYDDDVTMRTAPVRQNLLVNELYYDEPMYNYDYNYDSYGNGAPYSVNECNYIQNTDEPCSEIDEARFLCFENNIPPMEDDCITDLMKFSTNITSCQPVSVTINNEKLGIIPTLRIIPILWREELHDLLPFLALCSSITLS